MTRDLRRISSSSQSKSRKRKEILTPRRGGLFKRKKERKWKQLAGFFVSKRVEVGEGVNQESFAKRHTMALCSRWLWKWRLWAHMRHALSPSLELFICPSACFFPCCKVKYAKRSHFKGKRPRKMLFYSQPKRIASIDPESWGVSGRVEGGRALLSVRGKVVPGHLLRKDGEGGDNLEWTQLSTCLQQPSRLIFFSS